MPTDLMIMHLMLPGSLHLLGDIEPVGAVQSPEWSKDHLPRVEL